MSRARRGARARRPRRAARNAPADDNELAKLGQNILSTQLTSDANVESKGTLPKTRSWRKEASIQVRKTRAQVLRDEKNAANAGSSPPTTSTRKINTKPGSSSTGATRNATANQDDLAKLGHDMLSQNLSDSPTPAPERAQRSSNSGTSSTELGEGGLDTSPRSAKKKLEVRKTKAQMLRDEKIKAQRQEALRAEKINEVRDVAYVRP